MEPQTVREITLTVFQEVFKLKEPVSESTTADDISNWDSLNHMVLIGALEKKFDLKFDLFKLMDLQNAGDFIRYINQEINHGGTES